MLHCTATYSCNQGNFPKHSEGLWGALLCGIRFTSSVCREGGKLRRLKKSLTITVDGPAGAGKSTVSKRLADRLSYTYVDTGALYRVVAFLAEREGLTERDTERLRFLCENSDIRFTKGRVSSVLADGVDVTEEIRTPRISMLASKLSALPAVRAGLLSVQRNMAKKGGVVAEGRDMGTVVFPQADLKFFLDAAVDERARRRFEELRRNGFTASFEEVRRQIVERDDQDRSRDLSPLKPADDAVIIDSTACSVEEVVERMMGYVLRTGQKR